MVLLQALIISVRWLGFVPKRELLLCCWVAAWTSEYLTYKHKKKAVLCYFKRLSKYRIFISWCVKFGYRYRDLEGLQFFHRSNISFGLHGARGACLVMWRKSRINFSFLRRCSGWEYMVRNSSRAIHQDYFLSMSESSWGLEAKNQGRSLVFFPLSQGGNKQSGLRSQFPSRAWNMFLRLGAFLSVNVYKSSSTVMDCIQLSIYCCHLFEQHHPVLCLPVVWLSPCCLCGTGKKWWELFFHFTFYENLENHTALEKLPRLVNIWKIHLIANYLTETQAGIAIELWHFFRTCRNLHFELILDLAS